MADPTLARYAHIARRVHALLEDPWLREAEALEIDADRELAALLADTAFRLALYGAAMPGARPTCAAAMSGVLAALQDELLTIETPEPEPAPTQGRQRG